MTPYLELSWYINIIKYPYIPRHMLCSRFGWLHSFAISLALETIPTLTPHSVSGVWVTGHAGNGHRTLSWCTFGQHEKHPGTAETDSECEPSCCWISKMMPFLCFTPFDVEVQQVWRITSIIFVSFSLSTQVGATHVLSHLKAGTNVGRLPAADDVVTSTTDPCWLILGIIKWIPSLNMWEDGSLRPWNMVNYDETWNVGEKNMGSPYERDCYLGVPRFESETTGPQTTCLPLVETTIVDNHQQHPINSCFWFP